MRIARVLMLFAVAAPIGMAQVTSTAFPTFFFPRSTGTFGFGFQGAASATSLSSLQYNPSHSAFLSSASAEAGKFGGFPTFVPGYKLFWLRAGVPFDFGAFAVEYHRFSFGEFTIIDNTTMAEKEVSPYEEGMSLSFGKKFSEHLALGAGIRYGRGVFDNFNYRTVLSQIMFSAGLTWSDEVLGRDYRIGFSMLDFGPTTSTTYTGQISMPPDQSDPAPAELRLGVEAETFGSSEHELTFGLELSRGIAGRDENTGESQSSFRALFSNWKDFPRDVEVHTGARYEFFPIATSEWRVGQMLTVGIHDGSLGGANWMTVGWGITVGTPFVEVEVTTASIWHYIHEIPFFGGRMPAEQLQISMKLQSESIESSTFPDVRISGGFEFARPIGRFRERLASGGQQYSIEAAFYTSDDFALVSSFSLATYPFSGLFDLVEGHHSMLRSTLSARLHLFAPVIPLYVQAGAFLARWTFQIDNPQVSVSPDYLYNPGIAFEAGFPVKIEFLVVTPVLSIRSLLGEVAARHTGGYVDWTYGLRIGTDL